MRFTVCESGNPPIKATIEEHYVPWYCNVDSSTEWWQYASGLGSFTLPLICIIDPNDSDNYLDRTTGVQTPSVFYTRLQQHVDDSNIQVTPSSLNFGYVRPGFYKDLTLEVKNIGAGNLTGTVGTATPFSIKSGGSYSLGAGQSQQVVVRYNAPLQEGSHTGSLIFTGGGGLIIQLKGTSGKAGLPWLMLLFQ